MKTVNNSGKMAKEKKSNNFYVGLCELTKRFTILLNDNIDQTKQFLNSFMSYIYIKLDT